MAKWTKAADCKSVIQGSNPCAASIFCVLLGGWWNGRHEGLKIPSPQGGEGSTPSPPTKESTNNDRYLYLMFVTNPYGRDKPRLNATYPDAYDHPICYQNSYLRISRESKNVLLSKERPKRPPASKHFA